MDEPSDHLLRIFGAIPVSSRVLDLGCGQGVHVEPLARLGFDVYACDVSPEAVETVRGRLTGVLGEEEAQKRCFVSQLDALGYPDDFFDWVVAYDVLSRAETREGMLDLLREARRVLKLGGWFYVAAAGVPSGNDLLEGRGYAGDSGLEPTFTPRTLDEMFFEAEYAAAESPSLTEQDGRRVVQGIYRKINEATPD